MIPDCYRSTLPENRIQPGELFNEDRYLKAPEKPEVQGLSGAFAIWGIVLCKVTK